MNLDRATLELQARVLRPANFPRLAAEAIAAGRYGETLVALADLVGESQERVLAVVATIPDVDTRILDELGAESMTPSEAAWKLTRALASATVEGEVDARHGAEELTSLARAADDARLIDETARLEGILDQWEHIPPNERQHMVVDESRRLSTARCD